MLLVMLPTVMLLPAFIRAVLFAPGTGPSGPGRVALPAAVAGVLERISIVLGWPATGVLGPSDEMGGGAPREDGSLPAAVSGVTAVPATQTPGCYMNTRPKVWFRV